jgi:hypothetical protein
MTGAGASEEAVRETVENWLRRAVIGLNLCPFAKAVHVKQQIRYAVSAAHNAEEVLDALEEELGTLVAADPAQIDTTLLILPHALGEFADYNDFLILAQHVVEGRRLGGVVQIASFHPQYRFAGSEPDDIENFTNRAPFPILHLLRESSVERAVAAFPEAHEIYARNQCTLRELGHAGWLKLMRSEDVDVSEDKDEDENDGAQAPPSKPRPRP